MKITPDLFEAYSKCPTKCWLRSTGEPSADATYPEWVKAQNDSYRKTGTERLLAESPKDEIVLAPDKQTFNAPKWRVVDAGNSPSESPRADEHAGYPPAIVRLNYVSGSQR
jgi:hypothetical protein